MNKALGIGLLIVGVVLTIFGINASESFGSEVSRFFTGAPTDKSIWLLIGGIVTGFCGLFLTLISRKSSGQ
jgi:H+/Cl- antiporter ClcA